MNINVIASAFRQDATEAQNAINTVAAFQVLQSRSSAAVTMVTGSWKEEGQQAAAVEASMIGTVPSGYLMGIMQYFLIYAKQDAVLTVNPETNEAFLNSLNAESGLLEQQHIA
ncbi:hypothetical protein [Pseudomonas phage 71PfluR64PP]|uniref:Uncharacterized protein n=1 Tax=Pseudomonas phage 71PfluR64PP TaxID=2163977 RepID=A0A2S1PDV8_9CAUD|nr:hypothetical protein [Pseudomonas phage 71PfluR64PP]